MVWFWPWSAVVFFLVVHSISVLPHVDSQHSHSNTFEISPMSKQFAKLSKKNNPEQIHLSFGDTVRDVVVIWSTQSNVSGHVEYGSESSRILRSPSETAELKQNSEDALRFLHRCVIRNLQPGVLYSYRIVSDGPSTIKAEMMTFTLPHTRNQACSFFVVADMGEMSKPFHFVVHEILNRGYDAVFHIGDFAYNLHSEKGRVGDSFMKAISEFASKVPYMTTPGDHEKESEKRSEMFYHYRYRFSMPKSPWPMKEDSLWYSIDIGYTHFISINTEYFLKSSLAGDKQLEWLRSDLEKPNMNRDLRPWIVILGHVPMYCTKSRMFQTCDQGYSPLRDKIEDLFFEQGVDLYLSGHKHIYERSWPVYRGKVSQTNYIKPAAPVYIIIGSMGYEVFMDRKLNDPYWLAFHSADQDLELFGRLNVINKTHLTWSVHAGRNNQEIDRMHLVQENHESFGNAGDETFEKVKVQSLRKNDLPPEPLIIVDNPPSPFVQYRRMYLYTSVLILFLGLALFLRNKRFRKLLRL